MTLALALWACVQAPPASPPACGGCHVGPIGAHAATPCAGCHRGDPTAATAEAGHAGLEREPGALDTVDQTCGTCHGGYAARVRSLPMATGRGIVGVDRYVFGEIPSPTTSETLADVCAAAAATPGQDHLRRLCAGCHLGTRRANRDDVVTGGSGCAACHRVDAPGHPTVDRRVPDANCFGCHSRSSRISLSYAGWAEAAPGSPGDRALPDGRTLVRRVPDAHAAAGLACVDCHLSTELMGDGESRAHQADQVEIRCESCHDGGAHAVGARGTVLTHVADGVLVGKLDGARHPIPVAPPGHAGRGHDRLTCAACHAAAAPVCVSCHTTYEPSGSQWDFGVAAVAPGAWREAGAPGVWAAPALGVGSDGRIGPVIPGMIGVVAGRELRAFARLDPHSTARAPRSCVDCHTTPGALALGTGALDLAALRFTPARPVAGGVADDGWTTLGASKPGLGLRTGVRSLDALEQRRVLRVGVCLACHTGADITRWSDLRSHPPDCRVGDGWWDAR